MTDTEHRTPAATMDAYFAAWQARDAESLRDVLAADVTFTGPMGQVEGLEENITSLHGLFGIVTDVEILKTFVDGPDVATVYLLHTSIADPITTVNWTRVENGRATAVRAVFDPRPMLAA